MSISAASAALAAAANMSALRESKVTMCFSSVIKILQISGLLAVAASIRAVLPSTLVIPASWGARSSAIVRLPSFAEIINPVSPHWLQVFFI